MRAILQSLLIIAVTFVYVAGPYVSMEIEHSHKMDQGHGHRHTGDDHSHDPLDPGSNPPHEAPQDGEPDRDSHSHTHVVTLGADSPFTPASNDVFRANRNGTTQTAAILETIPDGPSFRLIKPPQVG
jgi:ABC-type nickel/cobalt efflux system permease component RcnA